jgi:hypothetical protein
MLFHFEKASVYAGGGDGALQGPARTPPQPQEETILPFLARGRQLTASGRRFSELLTRGGRAAQARRARAGR